MVLANEVLSGDLRVVDGCICEINGAQATAGVRSYQAADIDCGGDYLIPGLIELHTDHLETHYAPRPGVRWSLMAAIQAHDAQIAAAGITTVYDCLRMGRNDGEIFKTGEMNALAEALARARQHDRLRVEHRLHLRCEVSAEQVLGDFKQFENNADVGLVSLMDHAPGQRQFTSMAAFELYHKTKYKMGDEEFAHYVSSRLAASEKYSNIHRRELARLCAERKIPLASHDDATVEHVEESIRDGVRLAEFPTTLEAAQLSHRSGLGVLMGAPNVVRGQSHSGNVAARTLVENHCLDILSSDYIPASLLHAAFLLAAEGQSVPEAIATVSSNPAQFIGLKDRGSIAIGLRADLVQVAHYPEQDQAPIVRALWREGRRVM